MSEILGSNVTPEATLRFSVEDLYAVGKRLGPLESALTPPTTTFEELHRRAEGLLRRIDERKARRIKSLHICGVLLIVLGVAILSETSLPT
jgi:hypothetical protein